MRFSRRVLSICILSSLVVPTFAAFQADEFDGTSLGSQWTFVDSNPAGTTTTVADGKFQMSAAAGSDHYFFVDTQAAIQQDAPAGTNWEVVTKLDDFDFDPDTTSPVKRRFIRTGLQLWQDNDHFVTMSILTPANGRGIDTANFWQFDPNSAASNNNNNLWGVLDIFGWPPRPFSSLYMKIQSTPRGYRGYMSTDGTDWLECLTIVKNPETSNGLMINPKVRLFQAGGFYFDGGTSITQKGIISKFDYVRSNPIPNPTVAYADDEFDGPDLNSNWQFNTGIGVGSMGFNAGNLVITAGIYTDLWGNGGRQQPTYVFQDAPSASKYTLTAHVAPTQMAAEGFPYELWNGYGLWLWHDQSNWIYIMNQRRDQDPGAPDTPWTPVNGLEAAVKVGGKFYDKNYNFFPNEAPAYLRVSKDGNNAEVQYSYDQTNWTPVTFNVNSVQTSQFAIGADNLQIRLFSKRVFGDANDGDGRDAPPMDGNFDWLHANIIDSGVDTWELY